MNFDEPLAGKVNHCRHQLRHLRRVVIGLSGGVDSSVLTALARLELSRQDVLAVTATGMVHPASETQLARDIARRLDVELIELDATDIDDPRVQMNRPDRCYWCKHWIFSRLCEIASRQGYNAVASGSNAEDATGHRPGRRAEEELDIARPLEQAGLDKTQIRQIARALELPNADKPANPCLATRLPYGRRLEPEVLNRIEQAEELLRADGFDICRVRDHEGLARIEVPADDFSRLLNRRSDLVDKLRACGYQHVTLDLRGFRSGSMDETETGT